MVVMKGARKNGLYALKDVIVFLSGSITENTFYSKTKIWDKRL